MSKTLRKAIMRRSYLEKKYLKKNRSVSQSLQKAEKLLQKTLQERKKKVFQRAKSIFCY